MKCPRNCNGCIALYQSLCEYTCELGYEIKLAKVGTCKGSDIIQPYPKQGECPKPLTLKEFINSPKAYESEAKA